MELPIDSPEKLGEDGIMALVAVETTAVDVAMVREGGKNGSWVCYQVKQNGMDHAPQSVACPSIYNTCTSLLQQPNNFSFVQP
jgi:hypothetical protein